MIGQANVGAGAVRLVRQREVQAPAGAVGELGQEVELLAVDIAVCASWMLDPVWLFDGEFGAL